MFVENLFSIKGKTALVTGGSRGIGEMIASGFCANGAKVYITARSKDTVLDIGCNDGILLENYPKKYNKIVGVEPSNASKYIKQKRIKLLKKFFNYRTSLEYLEKFKKPKIITITNVLAQVDDLNQLSKGLKNIMNRESVVIIEFPYIIDMIKKSTFDIIYHEHLSYFSLTPLKILFG